MTTEPTTTTTDTQTGAQHEPGVLVHVDPHTVEIGENVRDTAALDTEFLASIAESGVLVPVTATRADDGTITIRDGQRRTLAARQAGRASIPVYLLGVDATDTVERITHQIVTNDHRADLTDSQRANGINQLLLAGVSVTKVAKKLSVPRETVHAAKAVAKAPNTMDALAGGQLSLTEAAAVAEFDDDPDALEELIAVAGTAGFEHRAQQLRQDRADRAARRAAAAPYAEQGYTVLDERPGWQDSHQYTALSRLYTRERVAADATAITDPTQWAVVMAETEIFTDTATGEPVNEDDIDWNTEDDDTAQPADGYRHANTVTVSTGWEPEFFCLDVDAAGLQTYAQMRATVNNDAERGHPNTPNTPDSEDQARERQREERRRVVALNKLGLAAQTVRRNWIQEKMCARKTPPKGAAIFVAQCLTRDPRLLDEYHGHQVTRDFLGLDSTAALSAAASELADNADNRAQVITLALVLGALEARTPKDAWRYAGRGYGCGPADLLTFLAAHGYPLADIEKVVTGELDAATVYTDTASTPADDDPATEDDIAQAS